VIHGPWPSPSLTPPHEPRPRNIESQHVWHRKDTKRGTARGRGHRSRRLTECTACGWRAKLLPTYWSDDAGRAILRGGWVSWHGVVVLAVWTVGLVAVAACGYERDSLHPASACTTCGVAQRRRGMAMT